MVPMMIYLLAYCELLILSLVGIVVCGFNKNIYRYVCKMIGGNGVFIVGVDLELLLLAVEICPVIGGGSLYLHCIVPLCSGH